jgi:hypothetical protein
MICFEGAFLKIAASPVKIAGPLAVVLELSQPPNPLQITGPRPPLAVGVNKTVLVPMTINELPEARLTGVPFIVAAGAPGTKVVPPMTIAEDAGASWRVVGLTWTEPAVFVEKAAMMSLVAPGLRE